MHLICIAIYLSSYLSSFTFSLCNWTCSRIFSIVESDKHSFSLLSQDWRCFCCWWVKAFVSRSSATISVGWMFISRYCWWFGWFCCLVTINLFLERQFKWVLCVGNWVYDDIEAWVISVWGSAMNIINVFHLVSRKILAKIVTHQIFSNDRESIKRTKH